MVTQDIQGWEPWPGSPSRSVAARRPEPNSLSHRVSRFPETLLGETLELQCQNEIDPLQQGVLKESVGSDRLVSPAQPGARGAVL